MEPSQLGGISLAAAGAIDSGRGLITRVSQSAGVA